MWRTILLRALPLVLLLSVGATAEDGNEGQRAEEEADGDQRHV